MNIKYSITDLAEGLKPLPLDDLKTLNDLAAELKTLDPDKFETLDIDNLSDPLLL